MRINYKKIGVIMAIIGSIWLFFILIITMIYFICNHFPKETPYWLNICLASDFLLLFISVGILCYAHRQLLIDEFKKLY
jgi:ABC-type multidrug transport system permease subunit